MAAQPGQLRRLARSGRCKWDGDTALQFRRDVLKPFFDQYLKDGAPQADTPPVLIYNTGENHWDRFDRWPLACATGCAAPMKPLYLQPDFGLSFDAPAGAGRGQLRRVRVRPGQAGALSCRARCGSPTATPGARGW